MVTKLNGKVTGNSNNDIKEPKQHFTENIRGIKVKGRYVKHPYLRTN